MKRWMKSAAGGLGGVGLLVAVAGVAGWQMGQGKMNRIVPVKVQPVAYAEGEQAIARGKYLYLSRGCVDCHGANGGGRDFVNDGSMHLRGPDISQGGVVSAYTPEDWVRILRHGVKPDGRPAMVMPSEDYNRLTDVDLAALVSFVRSLPPAQGGPGAVKLPLPVQVLYGFGVVQDAAAKIDHSLPPAQPVPEAADARHGAYVANACIGCHGPGLSGGKVPGGPPDWPAASNLTPGEGSVMGRYPDANAFIAMLRSGKRPDGTAIAVMPFESLAHLSDLDAQALHAFLKTVPPRKAGGR